MDKNCLYFNVVFQLDYVNGDVIRSYDATATEAVAGWTMAAWGSGWKPSAVALDRHEVSHSWISAMDNAPVIWSIYEANWTIYLSIIYPTLYSNPDRWTEIRLAENLTWITSEMG